MNTEMNSSTGSRQHTFFEADLSQVDRLTTPWIIVLAHRHFYGCVKAQGTSCNFSMPQNHLDDMEVLLYRYKVDLVLCGHLHFAQRSCPMFRGRCVSTKDANGYDAPVHAILGNAGMHLNPFPDRPAPWSVYEGFEHGFSRVVAHNATHLTMDFYGDNATDQVAIVHHSFTLQRTYPRNNTPPHTRVVTLSNTQLPVDQHGNPIITGEAHVLAHNGSFYVYFNNWVGGCFCSLPCTATAPPACAQRICPRRNYTDPQHQVLVYRTNDFLQWEYHGVAYASPEGTSSGFIERPHVIYCALTRQFVFWYQHWHPGGTSSFAVATSLEAHGPFVLVNPHANTTNTYNDANVFVDSDHVAYHISMQTLPCWPSPVPGACAGLLIQRLSPDFLSATADVHFVNISATGAPALEAPILFRRGDWYYATAGTLNCAAAGGTAVFAFKSRHPLGPYTPASADNGRIFSRSASRAQGSTTFRAGNETVWLGNQWLTSQAPDAARNYDLLRWALVEFAEDGSITPIEWQEEINLTLPVPL